MTSWIDPGTSWVDPDVPWNGGTTPPSIPTVTNVTPNTGPDTGGTDIVIDGTGFGFGARFTANDSGYSQPIGEITGNTTAFLNRLQASGATMLRTDAYWRSLQPTNPGSAASGANTAVDATALGLLDGVVNGAASRGIHVILMVAYTPLWARPTYGASGDDKIPPTRDASDYGDYAWICWYLADRYGPKVTIEVWNEPNISVFWKQPAATSLTGEAVDSPDVQCYSRMLAAATVAVKTGLVVGSGAHTPHPEVLVITGGTSPATGNGDSATNYAPGNFLLGILIYANDSFDHIGHHPYIWEDLPTLAVSWNPMLQTSDLYTIAALYGRGDAQVWATEVGICSRPDISGSDPASVTPGGIVGIEGYLSGAVGPAYNTSDRAINYTLSATRAQQIVDAWTAITDSPICFWKMNDTASPTSWASDLDHFGAYEGSGFSGAAKPSAAVFSTFFNDPARRALPAATVTIGGVAATVNTVTDTTIFATTPAHVAGPFHTEVTTPAGTSDDTSADLFTYTSTAVVSDFPTLNILIALDTDPLSAAPIWTDITAKGMTVEINRGRSFELDDVQAGTLTITLNNIDRSLDPTYAAGPYFTKLTVNRRIRVCATIYGTTYVLWDGFVDRYPQIAPDQSNHWAQADIEATDAFKWLAKNNLEAVKSWIVGDPVYGVVGTFIVGGQIGFPVTDELPGSRVNTILDLWPWPAAFRDIDSGSTHLEKDPDLKSGPIDPNETALNYLRTIRGSEDGRLHVSCDGQITFWSRKHWQTTTSQLVSQLTLDDQPGGPGYAQIQVDPADERYVRNSIERGRREYDTPITARDATSVRVFGDLPDSKTVLSKYKADILAQVNWLLAKYKDPKVRISQITINPRSLPAVLFPAVLGLELGDRITVSRKIANIGAADSRDYWIESISHRVTALLEWETTWQLAPVDTTVY